MYLGPYGPRGAERESEEFWTDIVEGSDMLPGMLPAIPGDPYGPAMPLTTDAQKGQDAGDMPDPETREDLDELDNLL